MSTLGLTMMLTTWAIVIFITSRFFMKVLKTPQEKAED
jgi:hypothetical protein